MEVAQADIGASDVCIIYIYGRKISLHTDDIENKLHLSIHI